MMNTCWNWDLQKLALKTELKKYVYHQAKELLIKCQLMWLLFHLMFGMNGKAPGSCNETKINPTM